MSFYLLIKSKYHFTENLIKIHHLFAEQNLNFLGEPVSGKEKEYIFIFSKNISLTKTFILMRCKITTSAFYASIFPLSWRVGKYRSCINHFCYNIYPKHVSNLCKMILVSHFPVLNSGFPS